MITPLRSLATIGLALMISLVESGCSDKNPSQLQWVFFGDRTANSGLAPDSVVYQSPLDGSLSQPPSLDLVWTCFDRDSDSLTFDIHLGTSAAPPFYESTPTARQAVSYRFALNGLKYDSTYYWQIVARDVSGHSTIGDVWSFAVRSAPNLPPVVPHTPIPSDDASSVSEYVLLNWQCSDPENDPIKYDVYFGLAVQTVLVSEQQATQFLNPGILMYNRHYHWYVVADDEYGNSVTGPTWGFTTGVGGTIAFTREQGSDWTINAADGDGSNLQQLISSSGFDSDPIWSPDGTKVAFVSSRDGNSEIYVADQDGSDQIRLTDYADWDYDPCWSPDGRSIAFVRSIGTYNDQVFVMNADGSNQRNISNNSYQDLNPAWSPDGSRIAFVTTQNLFSDIYIMNANGTGRTRLTVTSGLYEYYPAWSPDGLRLAFSSDRWVSGNFDIFVMNANGSSVQRLIGTTADEGHPCWSPDGSMIAFSSYDASQEDIFVMNSDGTDVTNVTNSPSVDEWSPSWKR